MSATSISANPHIIRGPSTLICEFVQDWKLSWVCKTLRQANEAVMDRVLLMPRRINTSQTPKGISLEEARARNAELLPIVFQKMGAKVVEIHHMVGVDVGAEAQEQCFIACTERLDRLASSVNTTPNFVLRLHAFLGRINQRLDEVPPLTDRLFDGLLRDIKTFLVQENLEIRFRATVGEPNNGRRLRAARESQYAEFAPDQEGGRSTEYSLEAFRQAEELTLRVLAREDVVVRALGFAARGGLNIGGNVRNTAVSYRRWFDDPENADAMGNLRKIELFELRDFPEEIVPQMRGWFPNLQELSLHGYGRSMLTRLPNNLPLLESVTALSVSWNNFQGGEIPPVIAELPNLSRLWIEGNEPHITRIGAPFARLALGDWTSFFFADAQADLALCYFPILNYCCDGGCSLDEYHNRRNTFRLLRSRLTEIPFELWFKEKFSIPHLSLMLTAPIFAIAGLFSLTLGLVATSFASEGFLRQCLGPVGTVLDILLSVPLFALAAAIGIPLALCAIALDLPFILLNLLIQCVIGPWIVFPIRHCLDYPDTVALEPVPEEAV